MRGSQSIHVICLIFGSINLYAQDTHEDFKKTKMKLPSSLKKEPEVKGPPALPLEASSDLIKTKLDKVDQVLKSYGPILNGAKLLNPGEKPASIFLPDFVQSKDVETRIFKWEIFGVSEPQQLIVHRRAIKNSKGETVYGYSVEVPFDSKLDKIFRNKGLFLKADEFTSNEAHLAQIKFILKKLNVPEEAFSTGRIAVSQAAGS